VRRHVLFLTGLKGMPCGGGAHRDGRKGRSVLRQLGESTRTNARIAQRQKDGPGRMFPRHEVSGGNEMRSLAKMSAVVALCCGAAAGAWAAGGPGPMGPVVPSPQPYAAVAVPRAPLYFGMVSGLGPRRLKATMPARVLANHPYRLAASFRGLTQQVGQGALAPGDLTVTINGREVPVGPQWVDIAAGDRTPITGAEVPIVIEITVKGPAFYPAGRYGGNLVLSIR
jgi:hypothetical protein